MRLLVTGSLGTLGRPLVAELRERGHEVWGVDLRHDGDPQHIRADVANMAQLERAWLRAGCPHAVYHLAAEFGRHNGEDFTEQLWRTAMVGTRNVLELCQCYDARLLFASSSEVYGELPNPVLHEDLLEHTVVKYPNEYALSKRANELQIEAYCRRNASVDATILRFFNAYGPGEAYHPYRSVVSLFCHRALQHIPLTVYRGYMRTFMFIDDFVPTLANVCDAELRHTIYNIGGTDYRSVEELAALVQEGVGTWGTVPVDLIPEDKHNTRSKKPDITRAREDLGHNPRVKLEEGVPLTIEWMRNAESRNPALKAA